MRSPFVMDHTAAFEAPCPLECSIPTQAAAEETFLCSHCPRLSIVLRDSESGALDWSSLLVHRQRRRSTSAGLRLRTAVTSLERALSQVLRDDPAPRRSPRARSEPRRRVGSSGVDRPHRSRIAEPPLGLRLSVCAGVILRKFGGDRRPVEEERTVSD